jgi:RNA polymerase sigma factor (sigma-70 family)
MSFEDDYTRYFNELRRFGRQMSLSPERCEDLIQETFVRYYVELKKEVVFKNPRAWLYKVFLNLFKTEINSPEHKLINRDQGNESTNNIVDLQEEYSRNERQRIVFEILGQLSKKEREILVLYHKGFTYAEMSEIMAINPNSVGRTVVRAIEKLKKSLKTQYNEMFEQN